MIGWLDSLLGFDAYCDEDEFQREAARAKALNRSPKEMDRGLSEAMSLRSSQLPVGSED